MNDDDDNFWLAAWCIHPFRSIIIGHYQTRYSPSSPSWRSQTYFWSNLRGNTRSVESLPWKRHSWCRNIYRTCEEKDGYLSRRWWVRLCIDMVIWRKCYLLINNCLLFYLHSIRPQETRPHSLWFRRLNNQKRLSTCTDETHCSITIALIIICIDWGKDYKYIRRQYVLYIVFLCYLIF